MRQRFTPRASRRVRLLSLLAAPVVAGLAITLAVTAMPGAQAAAAGSLAAAAEAKGRYFGTALSNSHVSETAYANLAATQFDMVTPENEMKWDTVEASRGSFNFGPGDAIVSFAQAHGQRVRGHNLVWHSQLPGWVSSLPTNQVQAAMENHITQEATHYKGKVYAWDVVNEPFDDSGNLRTDIFYQAMGSGYIADALRTARAADPNAKLYLNDYNIEGQGAKSDAMYNLASSLKSQGVPLDGIGFETHLDIQYGFPTNMQANMQRFANLGLDVAITEADVRMTLPEDSGKDATQSQYYTNVVNACLQVARCVGITVWGVTDKYSWVPGTFSGEGAALLYDSNYNAKPVRTTVYNALGGSAVSPPPTLSTPTTAPPTTAPPTTQPPTTAPPTTGAPGGCRVTDSIQSWGGGMVSNLTITSSTAVNGWSLVFTLPSGQTITSGWNATYSPSSGQVTAKNMSYNAAIPAGGSTSIGFQATQTGNAAAPSSFTLNGQACTIG